MNEWSDDELDAALAAAYGDSSGSVLGSIEGRAGGVARVRLRETQSATSPEPPEDGDGALRPGPRPKGRGAYRMLGEIARGGMGVVMKGHDLDLGRDIALKVLHRELASRPEALQRFVEEAQIGGQLQHPGVVPVHELGLTDDERPYFTMKLIQGRTLSELLSERASPGTERRSLLGIFEAVCQTVAYAHSRGVIHRDLKPSNVMVGAFGEVHVVDWGLAKVLQREHVESKSPAAVPARLETVRSGSGSSGSMAGAILGTPAYMAPEQARGEVEELDERADVFALGAILCEILSGSPPYSGGRERALQAAGGGEIGEAVQRLRASDADRELVALCEDCLAPLRAERPRNAEAVAQRLHLHLASVEERARSAQIESAEARVKALEERKARRLTVALAASVLVTALGLGGGWTWLAARRATREREIASATDAALADAALAQGQRDWSAATAALARAEAFADAPEADEPLRLRVRALRDRVDADIAAERAAGERETRNRALLDRLALIRGLDRAEELVVDSEGARLASIGAGGSDPRGDRHKDEGYAAAFATLGVEDRSSEEDAARTLRESGVANELALALDDWAFVRERLDDDRRSERAQRLRRIALAVDDDEGRRTVRAAVLSGDDETLIRISASAGEGELDHFTVLALANALLGAQREQDAGELLRAAQRQHRGDFSLTHELGSYYTKLAGRQGGLEGRQYNVEAKRYHTAAVALRPDSASALNDLGTAEMHTGEFDGALSTFRRAVAIDPDYERAHAGLCWALAASGRLDEAIEAGQRAIALGPDNSWTYQALGYALGRKGRFSEAEVVYRSGIEIDPEAASLHTNLGNTLLDLGQIDAAIVSFRKAMELDPKGSEPHYNLGRALAARGDFQSAIDANRRAAELNPTDPGPLHNMGAMHRRLGELDAAIECYRRSTELGGPEVALSHATLGSALREKGELDEAIESLRRSVALDDRSAYAQHELGTALSERGDLAEALAAYERTLELDPRFAHIHCRLSGVWRRMGELERAVEEGRLGIEAPGAEGSCTFVVGRALLAMNEAGTAIDLFRAAHARLPSDAFAALGLAFALANCEPEDLRKPAEAVSLARRAVDLAPQNPEAWNALGIALYRNGEFGESIASLTKASDLRSRGEAIDWLFLALAEHRSGHTEAAREWLDRSTSWLAEHDDQSVDATPFLLEAQSLLDAAQDEDE